MILKRKIFALFRDMDDDGDYDYEDAKLQYKDWRKSRKGYPGVALTVGGLGTAGAAYGGSKFAENRAIKKSAKTIEKTAKKIAVEKAKAMVGKTNSNGKKITAEDIKNYLKIQKEQKNLSEDMEKLIKSLK